MRNRPSFIDTQYRFTAHIRNPEAAPRPEDVPEQRMRVYNELLYNNLEAGVAISYPVTVELLSEEKWHALVREFFAHHQSHKHAYRDLPGEFLDYITNEHKPPADEPPFLRELLHYEWIELALSISTEEIDMAGIDARGDLLTGVPVVSPLAWVLSYDYPVHRISPEFQPDRPGSNKTILIVYRNRDDNIGFMETNATTARLLELLEEDASLTGRQALEQIAREINHPDPDVVVNGGADILQDLLSRDVIMGTHLR